MPLPFITSKSDYFNQSLSTLVGNWEVIEDYLRTQLYIPSQRAVYEKAYFYMVNNPEQFDGATMTEDMYDALRLDLDAMLHDYWYVRYNVAGSYHFTQLADKAMWAETRKKGKSSWNTNTRRILLKLKSLAGFHLYARYVSKRKMSINDKIEFLKELKLLL